MKQSVIILYLFIMFTACKNNQQQEDTMEAVAAQGDIVNTILTDKDNFYFIDFDNYPDDLNSLPVGIFDSGTGGLTVLKAIVNYDEHKNGSGDLGEDGLRDFNKEAFIYLGDQANMPYGNYAKENKVELLQEHIIKDAQFLMSNKYYNDGSDDKANTNKQAVKVIVVACNTATAYGKEYIEDYLQKAGSNIKVIGVIDAGVRGALNGIAVDEDAIIGVLATAGTVASKGYSNTINTLKKQRSYTGNIEVYSQGGIGIAEAVDEDPDYYDKNIAKPRDGYKGPGLDGEVKIDKSLFDVYNFNFADNRMLCDTEDKTSCSLMQINDAENYVRYHLVSLMENIRLSKTTNQLKSIILGCTHYPYLTNELNQVLEELYNYKTKDGEYVYKDLMAEKITLIDPAVNTAQELFVHLNNESLFNANGDINNSEFYISVVNDKNSNNIIDKNGRFPYDYKYGRIEGQIQEYVKVVPFSRKNISADILNRFEQQIPFVYDLMKNYNRNNEKTQNLKEKEKI